MIDKITQTNVKKNTLWILLGVYMTISIGVAIADSRYIYLAAGLLPFFICLSLVRPYLFPFGFYVFLLPFDSVMMFGGDDGATITKYLGVATILTLVLSGMVEKKMRHPEKTVAWWGLFVAFGVLSILWAIDPAVMRQKITTIVGLYVLYFVVSCYRFKKEELAALSKLIVYGGVAASMYVIVSYFFMGVHFGDTARASLNYGERSADPNQFAFSLLIPYALSMGAMLSTKDALLKILNWSLLGIIILGMMLTGSRGAYLGMTVILLVLMLHKAQRNYLIITVVILLTASFLLVPEMVLQRISGAGETGGAGRLDIWQVGLGALEEYWLLGAGLDNFPKAYWLHGPVFDTLESGPHNIYLSVAVELGITGVLLLAFAIYKHYALLRVKRSWNDSGRIWLTAALCGILVSSFFLDVLYRKPFWLIWMLIMIYGNINRKRSIT